MKVHTAALLITVGVAAACGGDAEIPAGPTSVVRDSAGVTIVENERPPEGSRLAWTVGSEPSLSIGSLDGEESYQLFRVSDALRMEDGRVVIVNRGTNQLRVFDADGTYLDDWGREGEGPGEFTGVIDIERWPGDSITAFDFTQRRMSVFDLNGDHGRTFALDGNADVTVPQFRGVLPSGRLALQAGAIFTSGEIGSGMTRPDNAYATVNQEAQDFASLGVHPGAERYMIATETFVSVTSHPFGRSTTARVWGDAVVIAPNDTYQLGVYDERGTLTRVVRRDHEAAAPTQADLDAYLEERFADLDPEARAQQMANLEDMPNVDSFPAFSDVRVDARGNLWVEEFRRPGVEAVVWTVFDPQGAVMGFMETPEELDVLEIGADYILGRTTDDFGVEYVQMWSLTR